MTNRGADRGFLDMTRVRCFMFAAVLFLPALSPGGSIRISFLADTAVLRETIAILKSNGCEDDAAAAFQKAVERYNETPFAFDTSKFPQPRDGFYTFKSPSLLVAALPHKLCDTKHPYELNCFDTLILLACDKLRSRLRPDDLSGPFLVQHPGTNGADSVMPAATARDAFALAYPPWYRRAGESILPGRMTEARMCLTAALFRWHVLPASTGEQGLGDGIMEVLRAAWREQDLKFPPESEVILCHEVRFPQRMFCTVHAGLLLPRGPRCSYLEKSGGSGPFVRLDFGDKADVKVWLSAMFRGADKLGFTHHFVTFNDSRIESLHVDL